ncbi:VCBS repeat-containing protein [Candidatus Poribacteria bacterium]|nr:VCBS repeat-containing protein [Candidatus Poribacteria bacterium]
MSHRILLKASLLFIVCLVQSFGIFDSDCVRAQAGAEERRDDMAQNTYQHRNLGKAYFEEDQIEKAIAEFEVCVALAPDSAAEWVNLAIAYLGAKRYEDAAKALDKAEALDATAFAPHIYYNRALLYKRQTQFDKAAEQFEKVKELDPACADTRYNLGLTYLRLRQPEKAAVEFEKCVQLIPDHVSAHYHLYRNAVRTKQKALADAELETFLRLKEIIPESQRTDIALERSIYSEIIVPPPTGGGEVAAGEGEAPAKPLKDAVDANAISIKFIDVTEASGLYSNPKPSPPSPPLPKLWERGLGGEGFVFPASQYTKAFAEKHIVQQFAGAAAFLDFDNDGYLDIYAVRGSTIQADSTNHLYHNNGDGTFTDVTEKAGVGDAGMGLNCVIGDYDNDGYLDIYVANYGPNVLYRNNRDGTFTDVTNQAGVGNPGWSQDVLFVDYDHEGDLDIYVANYVDLTQTPAPPRPRGGPREFPPGPPAGGGVGETISFPEDFVGSENVLYRNNGDGTFTDVTVSAGVGGGAQKSVKVFFSDFDDDNDIDLCVANVDSQSHLYLNLRDGKFGEFATAWGIQLRSESLRPDFQPLAVGDVNNDGRMDIVGVKIPSNRAEGISPVSIATNQDNTHFDGFRPLPATDTNNVDVKHPLYPYVIDYDNDGRLDLFVVGSQYGLFRNDGPHPLPPSPPGEGRGPG